MKIILLRPIHEDSEKAEKLLKKANVDFITILTCNDIDVPTLIVPNMTGAFEGLKEIEEYINYFN